MTVGQLVLGLATTVVVGCTLPAHDRSGNTTGGHLGWHDPDADGSTLTDRCPTEAGGAEDDGCHDDDHDDDGIPDDRDPCPDQRDTDALADSYDGCPRAAAP